MKEDSDSQVDSESFFQYLDFQVDARHRDVSEGKYLIALQAAVLVFGVTRFEDKKILLEDTATSLYIFLSVLLLGVSLALAFISYWLMLTAERNMRHAIASLRYSNLIGKKNLSDLDFIGFSGNAKKRAEDLQIGSLTTFFVSLVFFTFPMLLSTVN